MKRGRQRDQRMRQLRSRREVDEAKPDVDDRPAAPSHKFIRVGRGPRHLSPACRSCGLPMILSLEAPGFVFWSCRASVHRTPVTIAILNAGPAPAPPHRIVKTQRAIFHLQWPSQQPPVEIPVDRVSGSRMLLRMTDSPPTYYHFASDGKGHRTAPLIEWDGTGRCTVCGEAVAVAHLSLQDEDG